MAEQKRRYIESRSDIVKGINCALDDVEAGRTIPHDEAMRLQHFGESVPCEEADVRVAPRLADRPVGSERVPAPEQRKVQPSPPVGDVGGRDDNGLGRGLFEDRPLESVEPIEI